MGSPRSSLRSIRQLSLGRPVGQIGRQRERTRHRARSDPDDRGATLIEFAICAVLLVSLLFGIIEFSWAFNQQQDVRYGAREGARITAVNNIDGTNTTPSTAQIVSAICKRMDSADSTLRVALTTTSADYPSPGLVGGDTVQITVVKKDAQITGFFGAILNNTWIRSSVSFQIEQVPTWTVTAPIVTSGGTISGGVKCPSS